jgi:hypothetical protein
MTPRENLVKDLTSRLLDAGIRVYPPGFPYGSHHEYYRTRIRPGGRHARRSDVARFLSLWSEGRDQPEDYVWQAVCGGLLAYFNEAPLHRDKLPEDIKARMEALEWGEDFARFAAGAVSRQA